MNLRLITLTLQWHKAIEVVNLDHQISYFHGKISAGKSSIARLIDYCLGGSLEPTVALRQEFVSATLLAKLADFTVQLERLAGKSEVQATWSGADSGASTVLVLLQQSTTSPIYDTDVYTLSDLLFHLLGFQPPRVPRSKSDVDSPVVRLSFRDFMWYCYLEQDHLDSSLLNLDDGFKKYKSRDVMRYIVGLNSEKLSALERELAQTREAKARNEALLAGLSDSLRRFGFENADELNDGAHDLDKQITLSTTHLAALAENYKTTTHSTDDLRERLRGLASDLAKEEEVLGDLTSRIAEQESLRAELISTKFKATRASVATQVLGGVRFRICPSCGRKLLKDNSGDQACYLCKSSSPLEEYEELDFHAIQSDLTTRIEELDLSLEHHRSAAARQSTSVRRAREEKLSLEEEMDRALAQYDSAYLSQFRSAEQKLGELRERRRFLDQLQSMTSALGDSQQEVLTADKRIIELRKRIQTERVSLPNAEQNITAIENAYLECLLAVKVPGVTRKDSVAIDRTTWVPSILSNGDEALGWSFYSGAGSGGKKTLLNICYAIAIHLVSEQNDLPLPRLLIIDTPMKNIGEEVNAEIFEAFYQFLYTLSLKRLGETQFVIIDKEFFPPKNALDLGHRLMDPDDANNPPLITYYRGP